MIILFIAVIIGIFSLQYFSLNFKIQGLNRAVISTPIELFYQDVLDDNNEAKFYTEELENHLNSYYQKSLTKYVKEYEVSYYFYNKEDGSLCLDMYCDGIEITVDAVIDITYTYHRVMYYELYGRSHG